LLYGVGTYLAKIVCEEDPMIQWIIVNLLGFVFCCIVLLKYPDKIHMLKGTPLIYGLISATFVILATYILYYSLNAGRASIVVTLSAIGPAITTILAVIFLKEHITPLQIMGIVLITVGVILMSINS